MGLWGSDTGLILVESLGQCLAHSHCSRGSSSSLLVHRVCPVQFLHKDFISSTAVLIQPLLLLTGFTPSVLHPATAGAFSK